MGDLRGGLENRNEMKSFCDESRAAFLLLTRSTFSLEIDKVTSLEIDKLIEGRNNTTSTLTFRPTASDDIKELACRAENPHFPGGLQEDRRRLRIA
ncbi:unnamed protein product, partial [Timema podura]|nr:unnamed protein product [Timema podura]